MVLTVYNYTFDYIFSFNTIWWRLEISLFQIMTKSKYYYFIEFIYFELYYISYQNAYLCGSKVWNTILIQTIFIIFLLKDMRNLIMALVNVYLYIYNKISKNKDCNKRILNPKLSWAQTRYKIKYNRLN